MVIENLHGDIQLAMNSFTAEKVSALRMQLEVVTQSLVLLHKNGIRKAIIHFRDKELFFILQSQRGFPLERQNMDKLIILKKILKQENIQAIVATDKSLLRFEILWSKCKFSDLLTCTVLYYFWSTALYKEAPPLFSLGKSFISIGLQTSILFQGSAMAASDDLKLLGLRASPFVNRVQFALNLKSLHYEFILENLPDKSELLLKSNPVHKKVPVLIHAGKPICESLLIVQYIDEIWSDGPSILPANPYDRAVARFWAAYIDDKFFPVLRQVIYAEEEAIGALVEKLVESAPLLEDAFVECSKGKGFFGGEAVGFLDLVLGCHLGWLWAIETIASAKIIDKNKTPGLLGWAERFSSHNAIKGTLPEVEELLTFYNNRIHARPAAAAVEASK